MVLRFPLLKLVISCNFVFYQIDADFLKSNKPLPNPDGKWFTEARRNYVCALDCENAEFKDGGSKPISLGIVDQNGYPLFYKLLKDPRDKLLDAKSGFHGITSDLINFCGENPAKHKRTIEGLIYGKFLVGFDIESDIEV